MSNRETNLSAFDTQVAFCLANDAPITAAASLALRNALTEETATGRAVLNWHGNPVADGLVLRLVGGLHRLWLDGKAPEIDPLFKDEADGIHRLRAALAARLCQLRVPFCHLVPEALWWRLLLRSPQPFPRRGQV